jgi:hypothetical protein
MTDDPLIVSWLEQQAQANAGTESSQRGDRLHPHPGLGREAIAHGAVSGV